MSENKIAKLYCQFRQTGWNARGVQQKDGRNSPRA